MSKRFHGDKKLVRSLLATSISAALASAVGVPGTVWAQSAEATLRGKAPASTEVTAKNVATGAVRRTKSGSDGVYELVGMPPGTYHVDAGPGTETNVTLTVASTATLDLGAGAAVPLGTLEEVSVRSTRLVEVKTSEIAATVSLAQIETIPQITRNFLEFADTVPGMVFSVDPGGNASLRGGAQTTSSVNVYIDGVGQKSYVKEGGVSGQFFSQGNPFPQLAIGEYKVITSNYKAEFDQVSSAAVTAQTKSGTNEFHGEVFGTYTNDSLRAMTPSEKAANKKTPSKDKEYGFAVGGPIIQDQMHFFVTYEGKRFTTPITAVPNGISVAPGAPSALSDLPLNIQSQFGPADLPFTEDLFFGKIDWELSDADRIEVSAQYRKEDQALNIGTGQLPSASIVTKNDDQRSELKWQHSADRWVNELVLTYEDSFNSPSSKNEGYGQIYTYQPNNDQTIVSATAADPRGTQHKGQRGPGIKEDLTFNNLNWMGEHTVKMGAKLKWVTLVAQDAENINPQFTYDVNPTGTAADPYKAFFTNPVAGLTPVAKSKNTQLGLYLQDDWAQTDKLTWNLGVRWDYERTPAYTNYRTPANVIAALNGPNPAMAGQTYAQALALGGVNVNDYISTGSNRSPYAGEIQPRLGFSFDMNADQRHVVFGGYGRSYDRDLFDYLQLEETKASLPESTIYFQAPERATAGNPNGCAGAPCFAWDPKYYQLANLQALVNTTNVGQEVDMLNNHLKAPYSDQFSIGMHNRVGDWNTTATLARILSYDGFAFTLGNRYPSGAFWVGGGQPWGNGVPGFGALIIGNNAIKTRTTQVGLSAEKPYTEGSGWGATIAYTFTDATQNRDTNEHYSFDEEWLSQYPFIASNAVAKHRLVMTGEVKAPWGFVVGGKLTLATPIPVNDLACIGIRYPTGSNCTPIAGRPPESIGYKSFDLQITKSFALTDSQSIEIRADVLNVFNWYNYNDTNRNWGGNMVYNPTPVTYNPTGNITGPPRTLRGSIYYKF